MFLYAENNLFFFLSRERNYSPFCKTGRPLTMATLFYRSDFSAQLLFNKHRIAKTEKAISLLHRLFIGGQHMLPSR